MKHIKTLLSGILLSACIITLAGCKGGAESYLNKGNEYYNQGDYSTARSYFLKADESSGGNNPVCQLKIGNCYVNEEDYEQAVVWFRKAAEQGNADAQAQLGALYYDGIHVAEDKEAAVNWYSKAAEQGNAKAQFLLGESYFFGDGIAEDKEAAFNWYSKAAEAELEDGGLFTLYAQTKLRYCYRNGVGVAEDEEMAAYWEDKAAKTADLLNKYDNKIHSGEDR